MLGLRGESVGKAAAARRPASCKRNCLEKGPRMELMPLINLLLLLLLLLLVQSVVQLADADAVRE
jgi:biopolymer transport protein ExbD